MSRYVRVLFFLLTLLINLNCSKDDTPAPTPDSREEPKQEEPSESESEVYFTLNVDNAYESAPPGSEEINNWIFIHDENGGLLDYKKFENGSNIVFETSDLQMPANLTVTIFHHYFRLNEFRHEFETFPGIAKGSEWFLNTYKLEPSGAILNGTFNQTINNIPNPNVGIPYFSLSTNVAPALPENVSVSSPISGKTSMEIQNIRLIQDKDYLLFVEDGENKNLRYTFFAPSDMGDTSPINFENLEPVNFTAKIISPPSNLKFFSARALDEGQTYRNSGYSLIEPGTIKSHPLNISTDQSYIQIPILERFTKYQITAQVQLPDYKWYYVKQGENPMDVSVPDKPMVTFLNDAISDFEIITDLEYGHKISSWSVRNDEGDGTTGLTLRKIHSTSTAYPILGEIPEEFVSMYPKIDLENMVYAFTDFYLRSETYSEFIFNSYEANQDRWNQDLELEYITLFKE
ncbi:hypothetical protein [Ulvibacterium sp.]|uniref:hypothetical protein n=1 Tax=Ulvibacterium sp. TaxID=2665914 RepID=UPI003CC55B99